MLFRSGLALSGYSYEKGINETVIDQIEDYIVQIEIPVVPRACLKNHSRDLYSPLQASWTTNIQDDADHSSSKI